MTSFREREVAGALLLVIIPSLIFLFIAATADAARSVSELDEVQIGVARPPALAPAPTPRPAPIRVGDAKECGGACKGRCAVHSRQNVCNRACVACCSRCLCVPPGTSGNTQLCGTCYTQWLTHGNRTKCP